MLLLSTLTKGRTHDNLLNTCSTVFFNFLSGTLNHNSYNMSVYGMSVILKQQQSIMVVHNYSVQSLQKYTTEIQ